MRFCTKYFSDNTPGLGYFDKNECYLPVCLMLFTPSNAEFRNHVRYCFKICRTELSLSTPTSYIITPYNLLTYMLRNPQ